MEEFYTIFINPDKVDFQALVAWAKEKKSRSITIEIKELSRITIWAWDNELSSGQYVTEGVESIRLEEKAKENELLELQRLQAKYGTLKGGE